MDFNIPNGVVLLGDCLERMNEIKPGSIDMLFADLPYGTTMNKWDNIIDLSRFWDIAYTLCKENAAMVFTAQIPFSIILGSSNLKHLRYEWIYKKNLPTGHLNANKMPMKSHENVMIFYRKPPIYNPIKTSGHKRKQATHKKQSGNYNEYNEYPYDSTDRFPISIQEFVGDKRTQLINRTQKPVGLVEYMIRTYTNEGDTVLDPCAGSGTTAIASINTGRKYICIDNCETQYSGMINRIKEKLENSTNCNRFT